ncbi:hypothetical protein INR49_009096, partial [Caranx melampygus]
SERTTQADLSKQRQPPNHQWLPADSRPYTSTGSASCVFLGENILDFDVGSGDAGDGRSQGRVIPEGRVVRAEEDGERIGGGSWMEGKAFACGTVNVICGFRCWKKYITTMSHSVFPNVI